VTRKPGPPSPAGEPRAPLVGVVEDDPSVSEGLSSLLRSVGHEVVVFNSPAAFLKAAGSSPPDCLVVDIRLPGMSGLEFQAQLARRSSVIPIVFMTGHGDIEMSVRAMKGSAIDFLEKPFRDQDMLDAVAIAIARAHRLQAEDRGNAAARAAFEALTPREKEVMAFVTAGLMNKQVAAEIGVSEITVKIHRGNLMRKMGVKSLADLVRIADALGLSVPQQRHTSSPQ
jgi:FixJ family two-component response regulator